MTLRDWIFFHSNFPLAYFELKASNFLSILERNALQQHKPASSLAFKSAAPFYIRPLCQIPVINVNSQSSVVSEVL